MADVTAKNSPIASIEGGSGISAHTVTVEQLKEKLLSRGCYMADNIEEIRCFIRKRYPGLLDAEMTDIIKRNMIRCEL